MESASGSVSVDTADRRETHTIDGMTSSYTSLPGAGQGEGAGSSRDYYLVPLGLIPTGRNLCDHTPKCSESLTSFTYQVGRLRQPLLRWQALSLRLHRPRKATQRLYLSSLHDSPSNVVSSHPKRVGTVLVLPSPPLYPSELDHLPSSGGDHWLRLESSYFEYTVLVVTRYCDCHCSCDFSDVAASSTFAFCFSRVI